MHESLPFLVHLFPNPMHALHLPEVISAIFSFVHYYDLLECSLVCKSWRAGTIPLFWATVDWHMKCPQEVIFSRAQHIRSLTLHAFPPLKAEGTSEVLPQFPKLKRLKLKHSLIAPPESGSAGLFKFFLSAGAQPNYYKGILDRCPNLEVLYIEGDHDLELALRLIKDRLCPRLRSLSIREVQFSEAAMDLLLDICSGLDRLELRTVQLVQVPRMSNILDSGLSSSGSGVMGEQDLSGPRSLVFYSLTPLTLAFLRLFNGVQSMHLSIHSHGAALAPEFARLAEEGMWPRLDSLILGGIYGLEDHHLAGVIGSMKVCKNFAWDDGSLGPLAIQALERHRLTLESIKFMWCHGQAEAFTQMLLQSCPALKECVAPRISTWTVIHGPPLACRGLTRLQANIEEDIQDDCGPFSTQSAFFERLAPLTRMKRFHFDFHGRKPNTRVRKLVRLNVGQGVEKLAGWKELERITFQGVDQELTLGDVQWMVKHWPKLNSVVGVLNNENAVIQQELEEYLMEKEIDYDVGYTRDMIEYGDSFEWED